MLPDLDASNDNTAAGSAEEAAVHAETQIRLLLEKGPLEEAQELCNQALERFPESDTLLALQSDIRQKETTIRKLLDQGQGCLSDRDFETAAEFFTGACRLLPLDTELVEHIVGILHQHAQTVIEKDWQGADAALALATRIQPGGLASPFLADAVQERKHQAETDAAKTAVVPAAVTRSKAVLFALAMLAAFIVIALVPWKSFWTHFVRAGATTGTLTIRTNVSDAEILINDRKYSVRSAGAPLEIILSPAIYNVRATRPGYIDYGPVTASITKGRDTALDVELNPKPATLRVRNAEPGTEVRVDGVLVGSVVPGPGLIGQLSPGLHAIELSRAGFLPRKVVLQLSPGQETLLTGADVVLQSTDASERSPNLSEQDLPAPPHLEMARKKDSGAYADVIPALPTPETTNNPEQTEAAAPLQTAESDWAAVDKSNKNALEAFAAKYSGSAHSEKAAALIASLNRQEAALQLKKADDAAWNSVSRDNQDALKAYIDRFSAGAHLAEAEQALAELRSAELLKADSAAILALINRFANAWSTKDLDSILAIQRDLDRQALKSQLTPVKTIAMKISPLSPPQIAGAEATIVCRRQADETFLDGSTRQNPESVVTYLLSKRTGAWHIDGTR